MNGPPVISSAPAKHLTLWGVLHRVLILLVAAGSLFLSWWSVNRLLPLEKQRTQLTEGIRRLTDEITLMESKWTDPEIQRVLTRFTQAQARLFADQETLLTWYANLRQRLVPLALDANADFGKPATHTVAEGEMTVIPAMVNVEVRPALGIEGVQSPYERVLRLTRLLASDEKRVDIEELTVAGGSNSVSRAVAVINLWGSGQKP